MTDLVTLAISDGRATITLARPEAGNAMNWDLVADLGKATAEVAADARVRAVLITGEGKNFCVGGDLNSFATEADPADFIEKLANALHESVARLTSLPAPVVIAVNGAAAGAGLSLAAAGDVVLAEEGASFTMAYTGIGLTADGGATWLLPRLIGLRRTQEMAYTNRRLSAADAERYGLVTRIVSAEALQSEAEATARAIAAGPTGAFAAVKRLLAQGNTAPLDTHLDAEAKAIGVAMRSDDAQGAVRAFLDRKKPVFSGQ